MIINSNTTSPRFSLYHLDEGELYIKEFGATCQYIYPISNTIEQLKGILHFCSRSIIFEPDIPSYSITKFHFRNFICISYYMNFRIITIYFSRIG